MKSSKRYPFAEIASTPRITIDDAFFDLLDNFLKESFVQVQRMGIHEKDMIIYMPSYMQRIWVDYNIYRFGYRPDLPISTGDLRWRNIRVIDNFQNTVVVAFENSVMDKNFEPFILNIP